jgi:hypothetical protein
MGGPIQEAESFYTNNLGMTPQEARSVLSDALNSYSQSMQPQSMMQMASNGGRIGYQMGGGIESMDMNFGQPLQVPQQMPMNFSSAQSITSSPLLNYGQPQLGQAGETPLSMNRGGIARLGYQMGGEAMMQPQMGGEMNMPQMNEQQALETIIQLLIEQGIPPEQALQLASQILQIFAQGGEPALDQFINQLEQQEAQAMASGGIAGYGQRQGYFLGSIVKGITGAVKGVVKGVANAVKSVAKSPLGRLAITIGLNMLLPGAGTAFGAAMQTAAINMGLQVIGGGKFNPLETLTAGVGAYAGAGGFGGGEASAGTATGATKLAEANVADYVSANPVSSVATAEQLTNPAYFSPTEYAGAASPQLTAGQGQFVNAGQPLTNNVPANFANTGEYGTGYATPKDNLPFQLQGAGNGSVINESAMYDRLYPSATEKFTTSASNFGTNLMNKAQTGIQQLSNDPLGTISNYASKAYETAKENAVPIGAFLLGSSLGGAPEEDLSDDEKKRREEVNALLNYYGRNAQVTNPYFYKTYGAKNPFETAAQGGIMGYKQGGSMVPPARQIEGGVIELDARKTGGYIPYGKKERVDDVPAMLAKDEFVFTSRAVKAAGGGSAQRGAAKMYAIMKQLEGARA